MGFGGSNLLFSVIDTLIPDDPTGDNESLSATRDGKTIRGATADAHISDSSVTANSGGDITIDAQSNLNIDADITNAAVSLALTLSDDQTTVAISPVLSLNRLKYDTTAYASGNSLLSADDDIVIKAKDVSSVDARVLAPAVAVAASGSGSGKSVSIGVGVARSALKGGVTAYIDGDGSDTDISFARLQ